MKSHSLWLALAVVFMVSVTNCMAQNSDPGWETPKKKSGLKDVDAYLSKVDSLYKVVPTHRQTIEFYKMDSVIVKLPDGNYVKSTAMVDKDGNKANIPNLMVQFAQISSALSNLPTDCSSVGVLYPKATSELAGKPTLGIQFGKQLKTGPPTIAYVSAEGALLAKEATKQYGLLLKKTKSQVTENDNLAVASSDTCIIEPISESDDIASAISLDDWEARFKG